MQLEIQGLGKTYSDGNVALTDFNLDLGRGVFGLLGPNGAGKSTLLEILSLNLMPTTGRVLWEGMDIQKRPKAYRSILGYLPQTYGFYPELTARQTLSYMGRLYGLRGRKLRERIEMVAEEVNLLEFLKRKVKGFSGGMRQRLAIGVALIGDPQLLIIDEPTTGLDPGERVGFRNMLFELGRRCTVMLSTHIVKDVEFSCDRMALLYEGKQSYLGAPADFLKEVEGRVFEVEVSQEEFERFSAEHNVVAIREREEIVNVRYITAERFSGEAGAEAAQVNLEDAYVDFMRRRQREDNVASVR